MNADEFLRVQRQIEDVQPRKRAHPKGWEPGIDTAAGVVTVQGGNVPPHDWSVIIRELGLDPAAWTVDTSQPVQVRTWDSGEQRCFYYRATVLPARQDASGADVEDLIRAVQRRRGKSAQNAAQRASGDSASRALVVCLADWQAGKGDHGGVEALLERLFALRDAVPARLKALAKAGRPVDALYVIGMGDMVESCDGHYGMQAFQVQLDRRQQVRLVRRMLVELLTDWAGRVPAVVVGAVPGNHGENRKNGKAFTTFEDNDDLATFEQAQEVLTAAGFGNISWVIPDGDMTITLDVAGTVVSFAHGHQLNGSGLPLAKARHWWKGKMAAMHPVGDAQVLVYGHYHHLQVLQDGPRTIFGCPSNDGGSRWFEEQGGPKTACGTLTFTCSGAGWDDLAIL
jgi:predicted phosphodiesterase